jgi:hypothetical protein
MAFLALVDAAVNQNLQDVNVRSCNREQFSWDLNNQYSLAKIVKRYNGYMKTKDMSMKAKWELILAALKSKDEFLDLKISAGPLSVKFHRDKEKVLEKF